jgi:carbamoyltransferase
MENLDVPNHESKPCIVLGISAYYHDSSAALIIDGKIISAVQEERFTRIKGDSSFPINSIKYVLSHSKIDPSQITKVIYFESPFLKFDRILSTLLLGSFFTGNVFREAMSTWLPEKLWIERKIKKTLGRKISISISDHHLSHAASAFYPSPFEKAAILTIDGVGEWSTTTISEGNGSEIKMKTQIEYPNSLGLLYSAITLFCGFKVNSGEYKLMGLAPYGEPIYHDLIMNELIYLDADGSYSLNPKYFAYFKNNKMFTSALSDLLGTKPRTSDEPITKVYMDIASSIQSVTNLIVIALAKRSKELIDSDNLVLAGGVALNVVSIGKLEELGLFKNIWVQPAAGDAGGALGAALWESYVNQNITREVEINDSMQGAFLGPQPGEFLESTEEIISEYGLIANKLNDHDLAAEVAQGISSGFVVGIAKGRMEFGPRALGARSVLADARNTEMQSRLNLKTKFREGFRPFAPMVLAEDADKYFNINNSSSPYMLKTYPVALDIRIPQLETIGSPYDRVKENRSSIPAVTHVDYSARVQTIDSLRNPFLHSVITEFKNVTGCSVIINTSFNVRGEPIISSARDAVECLINTDIDLLVLDNYLITRSQQPKESLTSRRKRIIGVD